MNTQFRVSLSFEVNLDLEELNDGITEQDIRNEFGRDGCEPLVDEEVKSYIQHRLDPENILENASIQKSMVTHVEVTE